MKTRLLKEIREINEMLGMFRETKGKCILMMKQLKVDESELEQYKPVEKLFAIDLNILGHEHLVERKNKLMQAIDNIMKLESALSIRKARDIPETEEQEEQQSSNSTRSGFKQFNNFSQLLNKEPKVIQRKEIPKPVVVNVRSIEDEKRFNQSIGKLKFNNTELATIWGRNKPSVDQSNEDKLDRISRTLGALRKNGRTLFQEQRLKTSCINFLDYTEFNKVLTQLDRISMQNQELRSQIIRLTLQNNSLKGSATIIPKLSPPPVIVPTKQLQIQTETQQCLYQQIMVENEKFKIVKYYKEHAEFDNSIFDRKGNKHLEIEESYILKDLNDIGDSVIECIGNPHLETNDECQYLSNRLNTYQQQPTLGFIPLHKRVKTEFNPQNIIKNQMVLGSIIDSKDLNSVENKLKEMRQHRKKVIDDDDLWSQVQNMKI